MDLYSFMQWLRGRGVPESHLPVYRRGAESLLRAAGDGPLTAARVGEVIHGLTLDGATPRAVANLQRVGEALLEFQEAGDAPAAPLPGPIEEVSPPRPAADFDPLPFAAGGDDDAFLPVAKPMPPAPGPDAATAPRRVAAGWPEPAPPAAAPPAALDPPGSPLAADLPAAIEEELPAPTTPLHRQADDGEQVLELGPTASSEPHLAAATDARPPRLTGDLVRCPKCHRMQPRRAAGTCVACFTPFPHAVPPSAAASSPVGPAIRPTAAGSSRGPVGKLLAVVVLVGSSVLGAMCGRQAVSGCAERLGARPVPAAGSYHVAHLDLAVEFPPGWRHATGLDATQTIQSFTVRSSTFARGASLRRPEHGLQVAVVPLVGGFAQAPSLRDEDFVGFMELTGNGAARNLAGQGGTWLGRGCEALQRDGRRVGRCRGVASKRGETWNMTTYVVFGDSRAAIAVFGTQGDPEATRVESEQITASLRP